MCARDRSSGWAARSARAPRSLPRCTAISATPQSRRFDGPIAMFAARTESALIDAVLFDHSRRKLPYNGPIPALSLKALFNAAREDQMESKFADVNGIRLHYLTAGKGDPVVLLHGFAETSHMWLPLISRLSDSHAVIAPDLRGFGQSSAPSDGYT